MRFRNGDKVIISPQYKEISCALAEFGLDIINTKSVRNLIDFEQYHADMQVLVIQNCAFVSESTVYLKG